MPKTKKPRTAKQLANDERLRNKGKTPAQVDLPPVDEPIPTTPASEAEDHDMREDHVAVGTAVKVPEGVQLPKPQKEIEKLPELTPEEAPKEDSNLLEVVIRMQREIDELKASNPADGKQRVEQMAQYQGATVGAQGVRGRVFIYPIEPDHYPDPTERLYDEPKLRRWALRENFWLKWEVTGETYEKYGVTYTEPRFMLELWRFIFDDETGEPTGEMFLVNRHFQHEDELIARLSADKLGLKVGEGEKFETFEDLMNEMRYYRMQRWIHDVFSPFRTHQHKNKKMKQRVIGGRVVEVTDTEVLIDKSSGIDSAGTVERETQLTPAERREAERAGLL